jgi:triosephosphate isomerase
MDAGCRHEEFRRPPALDQIISERGFDHLIIPVQCSASECNMDPLLMEQLCKNIIIIAGNVQVHVFRDESGHFCDCSPGIQDDGVICLDHGDGEVCDFLLFFQVFCPFAVQRVFILDIFKIRCRNRVERYAVIPDEKLVFSEIGQIPADRHVGYIETAEYLGELAKRTKDIDRNEMELFIIPSYTSLAEAAKTVEPHLVKLGAQNMCWEEKGQFTGEISPLMLKELGIELVMVGHSERRHVFHESDEEENRKVRCVLEQGMKALLCIGETAKEKEYSTSAETLRTQLKVGLYKVSEKWIPDIRIAYEPVWSIGVNGTPASAGYAQRMHRMIKQTLIEVFGEAGGKIPVLYGGSVNLQNAEELIVQPDIDGLFVGRAAWDAEPFDRLIRRAMCAHRGRSC